MPIRIVIYGRPGDGAAFSAMGQIRSLVRELSVDASVQIVTDEKQLAAHGIIDPPAVLVDGLAISTGWVPSRNEVERGIRMRLDQLQTTEQTEEEL